MAPPKAHVDDDDNEDLDDLDDVLEQFTTPSQQKSQPKASGPTPAPPPPTAATNAAFSPTSTANMPRPHDASSAEITEDDFAQELARGMESLMRELGAQGGDGAGAGTGESAAELEERERAFRAAWEALLVEGMDGAVKPEDLSGPSSKPAPSTDAPPQQPDFARTVRSTLDKLKSSESAHQSSAAPQPGADPLEALLAQLGDLGVGDGDGEPGEDELAGMLESMMGQLMSREVLYEPLKELADKFPGYLKEHAATLSTDEKTRYDAQLSRVNAIVGVFDTPGYDEKDEETSLKIVTLMNEMQSFGSPPSELMGPLPPGLSLGPDGAPQMPEGCTIA
ncbi:hypothetical protein PLICRDRAFT_56871 [Plicaturopsis crispa FD-325 SS-3]|nr:hypothetical protein PLICRDRAFT_56871 [Plicaturopsis crispa FD-325 SS-3]